MTKKKETSSHSSDVARLYQQYHQPPQRYQEIRLRESIAEIIARWPLLADIHSSEAEQ